jgi:hypothetical protein
LRVPAQHGFHEYVIWCSMWVRTVNVIFGVRIPVFRCFNIWGCPNGRRGDFVIWVAPIIWYMAEARRLDKIRYPSGN